MPWDNVWGVYTLPSCTGALDRAGLLSTGCTFPLPVGILIEAESMAKTTTPTTTTTKRIGMKPTPELGHNAPLNQSHNKGLGPCEC